MTKTLTYKMPRLTIVAAAAPVDAPDDSDVGYWEGIIGAEGILTGDGRLIEADALTWETPVPLRFVREDVGGHMNAYDVGTILEIRRQDDGLIWARGTFDLGSEEGREAQRLVSNGVKRGVSMDLDDVSFEIRVSGEIVEEQEAFMKALLDEDADLPETEERQVDEEGRVTVVEVNSDDEIMVMTSGRIRGATLVSIPAFDIAAIDTTDAPDETEEMEEARVEAVAAAALLAAASPVRPPAAWFRDPQLPGPTPLTITDEGYVFGHIATWGTCHVSPVYGDCTQPPSSRSNYAYFRTGALLTDEGTEVAVGRITFNTGHAPGELDHVQTLAHYDNTGTAAMDVAAGEDAYGIWVAGRVRPNLSENDRQILRASPPSGDWRRIGGNLELVAVLCVNSGGFPIPRPHGMVASGHVQSLVAAGMVVTTNPEQTYPGLSASDLKYLKAMADRGRVEEARALAAKVRPARERIVLGKAAKIAAALTSNTHR